MAFVVEDGSGLANATSLNSVAAVLAYAADRGLDFSGSIADQQASCVLGADYLRNEMRFRYVGAKLTSTQRMPWPRVNAGEWSGQAIPSNVIPPGVLDAHCELAIISLGLGVVALQDNLTNGGLLLASKRIDVLEKSWFKPESFQMWNAMPGETLLTAVLGFLASVLLLPGRTKRVGALFQPTDPSEFTTGFYNNPQASTG